MEDQNRAGFFDTVGKTLAGFFGMNKTAIDSDVAGSNELKEMDKTLFSEHLNLAKDAETKEEKDRQLQEAERIRDKRASELEKTRAHGEVILENVVKVTGTVLLVAGGIAKALPDVMKRLNNK